MNFTLIGGLALAIIFSEMSVVGQSRDTAEAHIAAAKAAAGKEHIALLAAVCTPPTNPRPVRQGSPPRSESVRRTGKGIRQLVLCWSDGIFCVGRDDHRRYHRHRRAVRLFR